jgi:hypothetical protein
MANADDQAAGPRGEPIGSTDTVAERWRHVLAQAGVNRGGHRVRPGLYALGSPTPDSPVFVTANYALSFDVLRSSLVGFNAHILVLDTKGINVWCAAGKGTFGTDELVNRIAGVKLQEVVDHRTLILPQLGASGVAAHEVERRSGFRVEYGPVRAADLPEYLKTHKATAEMRQVRFALRDRVAVIPVEVVHMALPILAVFAISWFLRSGTVPGNALEDAGLIAALVAGVVLFPMLLPLIPTSDFSSKGLILGAVVVLPFAAISTLSPGHAAVPWRSLAGGIAKMLLGPPITAFFALNFTGSTTFTSRSGVRREIFKYVPIMAWVFGAGVALSIVLKVI